MVALENESQYHIVETLQSHDLGENEVRVEHVAAVRQCRPTALCPKASPLFASSGAVRDRAARCAILCDITSSSSHVAWTTLRNSDVAQPHSPVLLAALRSALGQDRWYLYRPEHSDMGRNSKQLHHPACRTFVREKHTPVGETNRSVGPHACASTSCT